MTVTHIKEITFPTPSFRSCSEWRSAHLRNITIKLDIRVLALRFIGQFFSRLQTKQKIAEPDLERNRVTV